MITSFMLKNKYLKFFTRCWVYQINDKINDILVFIMPSHCDYSIHFSDTAAIYDFKTPCNNQVY